MSTPVIDPVTIRPADWTVELGEGPTIGERPRPIRRRTWYGWSATSLPVAPLLLLGVLLGPHGLFLLTPAALGVVDPALPVAFAILGALVAMTPETHLSSPRAVGAAAFSVGVTTLMVAAGFAAGAFVNGDAVGRVFWLVPITLGVAASSSLIIPAQRASADGRRIATLENDAFVSVLAGGVLLAFARQGGPGIMALWLAEALAIVAVLAVAGWLLLRRSVVDAERRVFVLATLLLVGGAADSLSFSALLGGVCAGLVWERLGGESRDSLLADMHYAIHALIALSLVIAGARAQVTATTIGLAAGYAFLRVLGRVSGEALARRLGFETTGVGPLSLIAPGIFGIAFVLNAFRAVGEDLALVVSVTVLGTLLSELVFHLVAPQGAVE